MAFLMAKLSLIIFVIGAKQLVVQEAMEITLSFLVKSFSLTDKTMVFISHSLAGADKMTFFAPAVKCISKSNFLVNRPVHSITISTFKSFQGSLTGSFSAKTKKLRPSITKLLF